MKYLLLIALLFTAVVVHAQVLETRIVYDMANGDTTIELVNSTGALHLSCQITAQGLDNDDATFNLQKSNLVIFGDVPDARETFESGDSITFIEFANIFKNTAIRIQIFTNSVTKGKLILDINTMR